MKFSIPPYYVVSLIMLVLGVILGITKFIRDSKTIKAYVKQKDHNRLCRKSQPVTDLVSADTCMPFIGTNALERAKVECREMIMNTEDTTGGTDDERAIRLAVRTALTREGMRCNEAADGSDSAGAY
ncbi:MAG: hypothetical protein ACLU48_01955 [Clostridiaceae bacterium]